MSIRTKIHGLTCKIVIRSFDDKTLEAYLLNLKTLAAKIGVKNLIGPIRLPNKIKRWTVLRSPHIDKKSREQFEWVIHKRYLEVINTSPSIQKIFLHYVREQVPIGIGIEIRKYRYIPVSLKK
jgi:small subunit ribosomal protein S10